MDARRWQPLAARSRRFARVGPPAGVPSFLLRIGHLSIAMAPGSAAVGDSSGWRHDLVFAYLQEPPFCFRQDDGIARGCDVELAQTLLPMIGGRRFQPVEAEFAQLLGGLLQGRWMMTTGLFVTDERRMQVDFSRSIWALHDGAAVFAARSTKR